MSRTYRISYLAVRAVYFYYAAVFYEWRGNNNDINTKNDDDDKNNNNTNNKTGLGNLQRGFITYFLIPNKTTPSGLKQRAHIFTTECCVIHTDYLSYEDPASSVRAS